MINKINAGSLFEAGLAGSADASAGSKTDFTGSFDNVLREINDLQKDSEAMTKMFVRGEVTDLHQVMIATEKARLGMELMLEVRNRLFEGYQEIMRMQL